MLIAIGVGGILAFAWGSIDRWPKLSVLAFWVSFGGHWVELAYLNWLRPQLRRDRAVQIPARLAVWYAGGTLLFFGMALTAEALGGFEAIRRPAWWLGGLAFIGIELTVHFVMTILGRPSSYDGRG